ncbi:3-hydroxyacyl-[acyl-carrier-protein] dehydratase FabZ [Clostridia bacterium]|nr:3-hydroxyacyl-[acyl-carrier-protein] dehydratase FabZ [Clostridia bacterium]
MNKDEIKQVIPHRDPMLLVERVEIDENGTATGEITIRGDEYFLQGHFPENPVVPGVIQCEMMAQACCVLLQDKVKGKTPYFTGMDKIKFRRVVKPGDTFRTTANITRSRHPFYFAAVKAAVNGEPAAEGELSFVIK